MAIPRPLLAVLTVATAALVHVLAQFSMLVSRSDWSLSSFRDYGAGDQLSYMAIVVNASQGQLGSMEPFTETGAIYYPRAYYLLVGAVANLFSLTPTVAWALCGLVVQVLLVAALSIACILVTKRIWAGLFAFVPFTLGTLSVLTAGTWFTQMNSHALLWGPFAVLFPLNGEAAGLSVGGIALLLLLLAYVRTDWRRTRYVLPVVASGLIGTLANVQTYSFLTVTYLAAFAVAAVAIAGARRWMLLAAGSLALIAVVVLLGPIVQDTAGQLATLVFGLLPAIPGLVVAIIRTRGFAAVCGIVAVALASPSVLGTAEGLLNGDAFLAYRVASSVNLGVLWPEGLIGSLALTLPLLLIFAVGVRARNRLWIGFPPAALIGWTLLSTNDRWGANQEPYRFWIDSFILIAVCTLPVFISVVLHLLAAPTEPLRARRERTISLVATGVTVVLALVSTADWVAFYQMGRTIPLIQFETSRTDAISAAMADTGDGLVITDPCLNPLIVKTLTGSRIAHMNQGMAWPEDYDNILDVGAARAVGELDLAAAEGAGAEWVLVDSACTVDWDDDYSESLTETTTVDYQEAGDTFSITLERIDY